MLLAFEIPTKLALMMVLECYWLSRSPQKLALMMVLECYWLFLMMMMMMLMTRFFLSAATYVVSHLARFPRGSQGKVGGTRPYNPPRVGKRRGKGLVTTPARGVEQWLEQGEGARKD